jgi:hypothetical protein
VSTARSGCVQRIQELDGVFLVAVAFGRTGGKRLVEESSARALELQAQGDDARRTAGAGT